MIYVTWECLFYYQIIVAKNTFPPVLFMTDVCMMYYLLYQCSMLCALSGVCAGGGRQLGVGGDIHPRPDLRLPLGLPAPGPPAHHYHGQHKHLLNIS